MKKELLASIIILGTLCCFYAGNAVGRIAASPVSDTIPSKIRSFLSDSVPTPYGNVISRQHINHSLSVVSGSDLRSAFAPTLGNALFGRLTGLYVAQRGGMPGDNDSPELLLRGRGTFGAHEMLVLVDGFETRWSNITVDEIESIQVLKDAGSLAMFGQKGANGVMLITTHRGEDATKPRITFHSRAGVQTPTVLPQFLNNGSYAELYNKAMLSDGKQIASGYFFHPSLDVVTAFKNKDYPYLYPDVDWYSEVLKPAAIASDYSISVIGGSRLAKYFVNAGYAGYEGLYDGTDNRRMLNSNYKLQRYNIRSNVDVTVTPFLSAEVGLRGTVDNKFFPNVGADNLWRSLAVFNPYPVRAPDGRYAGLEGYSDNPVASILQKGYNKIDERTVDAHVKIIAKLDAITSGLSAFGQIAFGNNYYSTYRKNREFSFVELSARPDLIVPGETPIGEMPYDMMVRGVTDDNFSILHQTGTQWNRTTALGGMTWEKRLDKHALSAILFYKQEMYRVRGVDAPWAAQDIIGRLNYLFNQKYMADFTYSYSGSENFPKGNRFGFFPALSLGWIISQEDFMRGFAFVDYLKLKGSVGMTGNDRITGNSRFIFNQYYVGMGRAYMLGNDLSQNISLFREGSLANSNVTWEKALKYNIAAEMIVFQSLSLSMEYFYDQRSEIPVNPYHYIPASMGAYYHYANLGKASTRGVELEAMYRTQLGNLGWFAGGNAAWIKTRIDDMVEPPREYDYLYAKGNPVNQPFVLEAIGFFKDQSDIMLSPVQLFGAVQPGDIKYKDQNNDGFIDENDLVPLGKPRDPELIYFFQTGFDLKGFDFTLFFQGAAGRTVSLLQNNNILPFINGGVKPVEWVKDNHWDPERGDDALFPRLTTESNSNNNRASTLWQRNGSFVRLSNVEVGYSLASSFLSRLSIDRLRMQINGVNLWSANHIKEIKVDPEVMNMFVHPPLKSIHLGVTLHMK